MFIGVDATTVHVVYTTQDAVAGMVNMNQADLRDRGSISQKDIIRSCIAELGYKDIHYFGFSSLLLEQSAEQRRPALEMVVQKYIADRIQPLVKLQGLGLTDSLRYLQNARSRFETQTPEGYADCKSNCRNALVSCMQVLTGQEDLREGAKILGKQGIIGEREAELIQAFADLFGKLYGVASKKGPHPPFAEQGDAALVLGITTSVLEYVANRAIAQK